MPAEAGFLKLEHVPATFFLIFFSFLETPKAGFVAAFHKGHGCGVWALQLHSVSPI